MSAQPEDSRALHYAAIVASPDDAIVAKDLQGTIVSWNGAAERIFGYSAAEVVGKSITVIIPGDRLGEETEVLTRIRRGELVSHYETIRRRKDGTLVPISLTVSPVRNAQGQIIGASKVARDITDRRRAEAALAETERRQRDLQERLIALAEASGKLFGKPSLDDVQPRVLEIARALIPADAYAVWRFTHDRWHIGASSGVSDVFLHGVTPP